MNIKVKKLDPRAIIPTCGSEYSAGYDLYACLEEPVEIKPGETKLIGTGLCMELPVGYFGAIFARSGLALKQGIRPANCVGVCDCDYRGEYKTPLHNDSSETRVISHGDRIAQMVILPYQSLTFEECSELGETGRGEGGFGSTGK